MKKFDFYEFAAILCPGALLILALSRIFPQLGFLGAKEGLSFGDLGVVILVSYVAGHLVQALGNAIDGAWWFWFGRPTDWPRSGKHLISDRQQGQLRQKLAELCNIDVPVSLASVSRSNWHSITRQMYAVVSYGGRASRVDVFNGNYGMFRGIAASLIVIFLAAVVQLGWNHPRLYSVILLAFALAVFRMHRFGVHYARELFVQFLASKKTDKPAAASKDGD